MSMRIPGSKAAAALGRILAGIGVVALVAMGGVASAHTSATGKATPKATAATATFPPVTYSRYVTTSNMYTMGCNQGKASDAQGQHDELVLLNFGDPGWNAAGTFGAWDSYLGGFVPNAAIETNVKNYLQGFWDCTVAGSKSFMNVAPGVTNHGSGINSSNAQALGVAWGNMVKDLNSWISSKSYTTQLGTLGSADFEPGYGVPGYALAWANGFGSTGEAYYDFGSADGCPPYGSCLNGWTQADEYQLAWGNPTALAAPQIYNAAMAQEWASISAWGGAHGSAGKIVFSAALSQYQACLDHSDPCSGMDYTPLQSWQALYSATGQAPYFATEFSYQSN
jgi:hypothetical protein